MSQYPSSSSTKAHNILHEIDLLSTLEGTDVIFLQVPLQYKTRHQRKSSVFFIQLLNRVLNSVKGSARKLGDERNFRLDLINCVKHFNNLIVFKAIYYFYNMKYK